MYCNLWSTGANWLRPYCNDRSWGACSIYVVVSVHIFGCSGLLNGSNITEFVSYDFYMTIITRLSIIITTYDPGIQYLSCYYVLPYNEHNQENVILMCVSMKYRYPSKRKILKRVSQLLSTANHRMHFTALVILTTRSSKPDPPPFSVHNKKI